MEQEQNYGIGLHYYSPLDTTTTTTTTTTTINWTTNTPSHFVTSHHHVFPPHYLMTSDANHFHHPVPVPTPPPWMMMMMMMPSHETSQNYVDFLAHNGYPDHFHKQMPHSVVSSQLPTLALPYPSHFLGEHPSTHYEGNFAKFTSMEHKLAIQKQDSSEACSHHVFPVNPISSASASEYDASEEARRKRSREKAYAADRRRKLRIAQGLDALQELFPQSKEGSKADLLDDVIDHVKYLQKQVKDLSQIRLGGESTSKSFVFVEGHGHYIASKQMLSGPLEDIIGKLIEVNPSAVTQLLQSRGLMVMPSTFAEALKKSVWNMQEKGAFPIPK